MTTNPSGSPWEQLARSLDIPTLGAHVLWNRGIKSAAEYRALMDGSASLAPPEELPDLMAAAHLIRRAVQEGQAIRVHGDYDADGVTATAVLVRCLREVFPGARVDWHVPSRFDEGYGVSPEAVWRAHQDGVGLMVTVDCGSSSPEAARLADSLGMALVVTDHHRLPEQLPTVPALVNPERMAVPQVLSGAGVALQLARALYGFDPPPPIWGLAAVGTVADVVPLVKEARAVVRRGLDALAAGAVPGIAALLRAARRDPTSVSARDVAFSVGPRINAAGRMGRPEPAVLLCLVDKDDEAAGLAERLEALNRERRDVEEQVRAAAVASVEARSGELPAFLVVHGPWHEGVVGIVAARLADRYRRPAAVIAMGPDRGKGSARARSDGDLTQALSAVDGHFTKWGGHRGAAGFSLHRSGLAGLEDDLSRAWTNLFGGFRPTPAVPVDAEAAVEDLTPDLARFLRTLEPFGHGFPEPRFRVSGLATAARTMGAGGSHLRLELRGERLESVAFNLGAYASDLIGRRVAGPAALAVETYRGREQIRIRWEAFEVPAGPPASLESVPWRLGAPDPGTAGVLVLVDGRRRQRQMQSQVHGGWAVASWWRDEPPPTSPFAALWIRDPPPHAAALRAAIGRLGANGVVYWDPEALSGPRVTRLLSKWTRLVPDRERLLSLWRTARTGRAGLVPGRAVLEELGLGGGRTPAHRRELADSVRFTAAHLERERAWRDWRSGTPWAWRESGKGAERSYD